jgi:MFS family permease
MALIRALRPRATRSAPGHVADPPGVKQRRTGADIPTGSWAALVLIALAQVGAMSTWFSVTAVAPSLARDWQLSAAQLGLLTSAVQLGFVAGALTSGVTGVADVVSARRVFAASALAAAVVNALLLVTGGDLRLAAILRFGLGFSLAGVYPTGMKLMTGWFRTGRGLAIGTLVGALTIGSALPHLIVGGGLAGMLPWQGVLLAPAWARSSRRQSRYCSSAPVPSKHLAPDSI